MNLDLKRQIAELREMTPAQLRRKHLEVFGEETNAGHREYLFRRIAWKLQALAEGDLSERARKRAMELAQTSELRTTAPRAPQSVGSQIAAISRGGSIRTSRTRLPIPGTVLTRVFKGVTYQVTVLPAGFEMDGQVYKSLTAIAKHITGSHWNGHLFFGLTAVKKEKNPV